MTTRSREELERALRELDALAVAIPEPGDRTLEREEVRRRALELARAHGFSHLAVELRKSEDAHPDRATLSGD